MTRFMKKDSESYRGVLTATYSDGRVERTYIGPYGTKGAASSQANAGKNVYYTMEWDTGAVSLRDGVASLEVHIEVADNWETLLK